MTTIRGRALRLLVAAALLGLLTGCGPQEHSDLRQELDQLTKGLRGKVPPLPEVKPYEPVPYTAEDEVDPFRPDRIEVVQADKPRHSTGLAPDLQRPKEPLEAFPLESIEMVGTITRGKQTYGLVKAGQNLYRVSRGNYMGQNFGVVTSINDSEIDLKELVQDGTGEWVERSSSLMLQEKKK